MSVAECISKRIKYMPKGKPFTNARSQRWDLAPRLIKHCLGWCRAAS